MKRLRSAARLEGFANRRMEPVGFVREHTEIGTHDRLKRLLRGHFSEADLTKLLAEGAALAEDRAVDEALLPEIAIR